MKTLSKIKLSQFSKEELEQRALNALKGGSPCGCCGGGECEPSGGCNSSGPVGVSSADAFAAISATVSAY